MNLHRNNHCRLRAFTFATLTALAVLISGCGGGGGSPAPSGNTAAVAASGDTTAVSVYQPPLSAAATAKPAATGDVAADGVNWMNYRRAQFGLAPMTKNAALGQAAQAHANYLTLNDSYSLEGHDETPSKPGFTGVDPIVRMLAAGYPRDYMGENMHSTRFNDGADKTDELIDAPYHRKAQLGDYLHAGGGSSFMARTATRLQDAYHYVINFGGRSSSWGPAANQIAVLPTPGQQDAPTGWMARERPHPVPDLDGQRVGYPISLQSASGSVLAVSSFALNDSRGIAISGRLITTRTDTGAALNNQAFWIPLAPLAPASNYTATASGSLNGVAMKLSWAFKTMVELPMAITASSANLPALPGSMVSATLAGGTGRQVRFVGGASGYYYKNMPPAVAPEFASIRFDSPGAVTVVRSATACDPAIFIRCEYRLFGLDEAGAQVILTLPVS